MGLEENLKEMAALRRLLGLSGEGAAFGHEVRLARTKRGLTLEALSAATGMAKSYLSQIETGYAPPPRDDKVHRLAEALGINADGLVARAHLSQMPDEVKQRLARLSEVFDSTEDVMRALLAARDAVRREQAERPAATAEGQGEGAAPAPADAARPDARDVSVDLDVLHRSGLLHQLAEWGDARVESRRGGLRAIPIINKVSAGYPQEFTDLGYPVGIADAYVSVPVELADPNAFAVRVVGDSMEPRYHEGDVIIFAPSAGVKSGDDCFVRFGVTGGPIDGESTFKRVFFDAEDRVRLQPLNERYAPTVVKPSEIAAIFRAAARYEQL
ncbi:MAG: LexA family transcriptional regulator [Planctomycetes bacterium]|nr:LexA family transcriptional regulator [Planctomycetota bacterium]